MKTDIPLQWHMHVDDCMISEDRDFWGNLIYVVEDDCRRKDFQTP